jgi:hypothetical protein
VGELVPSPVAVKGAILGFPDGGDRVLELLEYPRPPGRPRPADATWFADPYGLVFILLEKRDPEKPYYAQY